MQLIWVSGPVGRIRRVNLTARRLLIFAGAASLVLILVGVMLEFAGFRIAVEYDPKIVRHVGNFYSESEIRGLKEKYETRVDEIEKNLAAFHDRLNDLDELNRKLKLIATPPPLISRQDRTDAMGGPFIGLPAGTGGTLMSHVEDLHENASQLLKYSDDSLNYWKNQLDWLESKPILFPLKGEISITSGYGERVDPIVNRSSFHPGLDFQGSVGESVYATANGVVEFAGWDAGYGQSVIIDHGDGYQTRYAHMSRLFVKEGETVSQREKIGVVGSTGRSTGPHLHYEIIKDGRTINPETMLLKLAHR